MRIGPKKQANKACVHESLMEVAVCEQDLLDGVLEDVYHAEARWFGSHPLNELHGIDAVKSLWHGMRDAFPDIERRDSIFLGGTSEGSDFVAAVGHYQANFIQDWLGIPATHGVVHLRYGEVHKLVDGKIAQTYALIDLLDLLRQSGIWPIAASLGAEIAWPGPATCDGLRLAQDNPAESQRSIDVMLAMHQGLFNFDGEDLESMEQHKYWTKNFLWYGPAGIGTVRGVEGYRAGHQIPFLRAFPDRGGAGHYISMASGNYAVTGGWPSVRATHLGPDWLGLAATGKQVGMRVMDFYRVEDGLIAENWVPIDIIHVLLQLGTDVFGRVAQLRGNRRKTL